MILVETVSELREALDMLKHKGYKVGFVPTMGALHRGHISLIEKARSENQVVVSSIFVNPTQFNDKKDLVQYPRTPEADAILLSDAGCHLLFMPPVKEVYPEENLLDMDFGSLEQVMEGSYRQGHFKGVATVVARLFELVKPDRAYFGEKDFQQLVVINEMNRRLNTGIIIVGCETLREPDGLALSSRNIHLTGNEREQAGVIYNSLLKAAENIRTQPLFDVKQQAISAVNSYLDFKVQYLEFVDSHTLLPIEKWEKNKDQRACIAVLTSRTRLIDNIPV